MSDPSEVIPGAGVAPGGEEQGGGRRKGRGKSRDPGRAREELGDVETRLAKVELHLIEGEQKFEEMDNRLEELDGKVDELQDELRGALDSAVDKLASEGESLRLSYLDNYAALKDENRSLREQVDRVSDENTHLREELDKVLGKLKEVEQQVSLVAIAIVQGGGANASGATMAMPSRVEVPKPSSFKGSRDAKEIDNFLWNMEQYFRALGITDDARKIDHAPLYLADTATVWWRRRQADREKGLCIINTWEDFKKELKRQFYPENVAKETRARLRRLSQKGSIRDYVKEFSETLLEIPDYPDQEAFYTFLDGLQHWAKMEVERRGADNLASAIAIAESLTEYKRNDKDKEKNKGRGKPYKEKSGGDSSHNSRPTNNKEGGSKKFKEHKKQEGPSKGQHFRRHGDRPPLKCFLCEGPHRAWDCPKKAGLQH
ncbi:hypothetical protein GH714_043937 [Hevea brasiliensis]|uniref:Retrotransposon gag domain-containing protein n=1 Tax=Hevea brasiliensis TaxID=3981 RepID=A0A6A6JZW7_HEVBR|nr:hypothetical protein GH714_043937 [Hevea brasiliensis]